MAWIAHWRQGAHGLPRDPRLILSIESRFGHVVAEVRIAANAQAKPAAGALNELLTINHQKGLTPS
jgi:hypothetical protein